MRRTLLLEQYITGAGNARTARNSIKQGQQGVGRMGAGLGERKLEIHKGFLENPYL